MPLRPCRDASQGAGHSVYRDSDVPCPCAREVDQDLMFEGSRVAI